MQNEIRQTKEIQAEFDTAFTELLNLLSSFDQKQFNTKLGKEKWSAGKVSRHLIKATSGLPQVLNGETAETKRRPDEMVEKIRVYFSNFERKMTAPDFLEPKENVYERDDLLFSLYKKNLK